MCIAGSSREGGGEGALVETGEGGEAAVVELTQGVRA